jgi:hypothetical protein
MVDVNFVIGTLGLLFLLIGFISNAIKKLTQDQPAYLILNILGAGFLAYYAYTTDSIPFLILEGIWTVFSIYKLITVYKK